MKVGIVGLGLIGGSFALACRAGGHEVIGSDVNSLHRSKAIELGLIESACTLKELIAHVDMIVVAIPVDAIAKLLPSILDKISDQQMVVDLGSTKSKICNTVEGHRNRGRYLASHPLAGTEYSGPTAAFVDLYRGKKNIICERDRTDEDVLLKMQALFDQMELQCLYMSAADHDKHLAYVSHLSHVSAFTLGLTVLDIEKDEKQILNLAGTGFRSTVRLAKSSPQTWTSIFTENSSHLVTALEQYITHLVDFKDSIANENKANINLKIVKANKIAQVLNGIKIEDVIKQ